MSAMTHFIQALATFIPAARLIQDPLRRLAYGTDASFYRLIPQLVVRVVSEEEVIQLVHKANEFKIALTFRAAGTSLSGQAVTDSVLVQLQGWTDYQVQEGGLRVRLQPGIIGAHANRYLAAFGRKIGPDPASINAAKIGGIASNNASGMCCGTRQNSYHTLAAIRVVLADGSVLDTAEPASIANFRKHRERLLTGLQQLRSKVTGNPELSARIRRKYRLKNTTGYGLNALLDYDDPVDILAHLLIGSEGTLGFISNITYHTVEEHQNKATTMVFFDSIHDTCEAVMALKESPVSAVELIDRRGLSAIESKPGVPALVKALPKDAAALLIETRAGNGETLTQQIAAVTSILGSFPVLEQLPFSQDPAVIAQLWNIRKGLFPALGALRGTGTTVVIEDVAFPIPDLAAGVLKLQALFGRYGYDDALIFGHALEGNLHFVFAQDLNDPNAIDRYRGLMEAVAHLVAVEYEGSLKAEHGTGRNMAPFVALEWGQDGHDIMAEIKALFDPHQLLNPGVILNTDPEVHLKNLKPMPAVDNLVDRCIECGFCEPVCPSRNLTLTPRQRIVGARELARMEGEGKSSSLFEEFNKAYQYQADDTCAACGLCTTSCPVGINTGDLTRLHRSHQNQEHLGKARWAAEHFAGITKATRVMLGAADATHRLIGESALTKTSQAISNISGGKIPTWHPYLPKPASASLNSYGESPGPDNPKRVVYFSSCAARAMGPARGDKETRELSAANLSLLRKGGYEVLIPHAMESQCCGMPFQSKGFFELADLKAEELLDELWRASGEGQYPVFSDTSPCTMRLKESLQSHPKYEGLNILDTVDFIHDHLLECLDITPEDNPVALHITCSTTKMGLADKLTTIARKCSSQVVIPESITCCGFAGDRGFTHPELNASALAPLRNQVTAAQCREGVSNSRSCEIGLSLHSGIHYHGISLLLDRVSTGQRDLSNSPENRQS